MGGSRAFMGMIGLSLAHSWAAGAAARFPGKSNLGSKSPNDTFNSKP